MLDGLSPFQGEDDLNMSKVMDAKMKYLNKFPQKNPKYSVGTYVRVKKEKYLYHKGYNPTFTDTIYKISSVRNHLFIPLYTLSTYDDTEELKVIFLEAPEASEASVFKLIKL